jgi:rSAM/selenodomain-associated transferase 1
MADAPRRPAISAAYFPRLIIMAKRPKAGGVKRRLAGEIGATKATQFARACLSHTLLKLARDRRWRTVLAVAPNIATHAASWPRSAERIERMPQGPGNLGQRMQRLFRRLPPGPAIIVGGDIPGLTAREVATAFQRLRGADAVMGPAADGGYWLIGLRRSPTILAPFRGVRWSTQHALADTLANLEGRKVATVATLSDVDASDAYGKLRATWQRLIPRRA